MNRENFETNPVRETASKGRERIREEAQILLDDINELERDRGHRSEILYRSYSMRTERWFERLVRQTPEYQEARAKKIERHENRTWYDFPRHMASLLGKATIQEKDIVLMRKYLDFLKVEKLLTDVLTNSAFFRGGEGQRKEELSTRTIRDRQELTITGLENTVLRVMSEKEELEGKRALMRYGALIISTSASDADIKEAIFAKIGYRW